MRWFDPEDRSEAVITAQRHVKSSHGTSAPPVLPEVCVLFEMGRRSISCGRITPVR